MAKATKATVQVKKKRWVQILAPKMFNEVSMGETYITAPQDAVGRNISVSVMILTGEPGKQYISAGFDIVDAVGEKLHTAIRSYKILPSALRKLVRRNKDKFEDSFVCETADKKLMRLKPFVVTRNKTTGSRMAALRKATRERTAQLVAPLTAEQVFSEIIGGKIQKGIFDIVRKTNPVGAVEFRWAQLLPAGTKVGIIPVVPVKEEKKKDAKADDAEGPLDQAAEAEAEQAAKAAKLAQDDAKAAQNAKAPADAETDDATEEVEESVDDAEESA
jgi:small subunit ribosomal protein S3Ae